jgi:hypothetical protein
MKSLNDVIWNDNIDLEKGKKGEIGLGRAIGLLDSCGTHHDGDSVTPTAICIEP